VTPADLLAERSSDPFCERGVLAAIHALADFSHSKAMADLVTAGKWVPELLITLGKVAPPRYAHFIARRKDDPDPSVRGAVGVALGLMDNDAITIPVLIQLLSRGDSEDDFPVRWAADESLVVLARRKGGEKTRRRLADLLLDRDRMTVVLAARALALVNEPRGLEKLREQTTDGDRRVRREAILALGEAADRGSRDVLRRRLQDDNVAVRACAVWALGQVGGPSVIPTLRKAVEDSLAYERELERRKQAGASERTIRDEYGLGAFDLRQTLEEAIAAAQKKP
jgi:HEAT repeat protein